MRINISATALLAAIETASVTGCANNVNFPAKDVTDPVAVNQTEVQENTKSVISFTVGGRLEQRCDVASDDHVFTEPEVETSNVDCHGYLISCEETWKYPVVNLPFRQLWPEVMEKHELNLFHDGHATFFSCPEGSRMETDENELHGCLESRFKTVAEKGETCASGRNEMVPLVACDPDHYSKTVIWQCMFDGTYLSDMKAANK